MWLQAPWSLCFYTIIYYMNFNHVGEHKNKEAYNCGLTSVTDNPLCLLHYHLKQTHIQVIKLNYKKKWNLHKKLSCKERCGPCKKDSMKKLWNLRWWPRSDCDGKIMAKVLIIKFRQICNLFMLLFFAWAAPLAVFV